MPRFENDNEYWTAAEAASFLEISRQHFYEAIAPTLEKHQLGIRRQKFFLASDIKKLTEKTTIAASPMSLPIIVHGIQKNFVTSLQSKGIPCVVKNVGVPEEVPVDETLASIFSIQPGSPIVRRGRLQGVPGTPYRLVCNWYPTRYCDPQLLSEMRTNDDADMPALIKEKYGIAIEEIEETVITRKATPDERKALELKSGESVFEIRRINYARDSQNVVMVSDLILVARYFKLKYTYHVDHWTK